MTHTSDPSETHKRLATLRLRLEEMMEWHRALPDDIRQREHQEALYTVLQNMDEELGIAIEEYEEAVT